MKSSKKDVRIGDIWEIELNKGEGALVQITEFIKEEYGGIKAVIVETSASYIDAGDILAIMKMEGRQSWWMPENCLLKLVERRSKKVYNRPTKCRQE